MISDNLSKYQENKQRQEELEHRDVLLAIAVILKTNEGLQLFRYLFKNLEIATVPDPGMEGTELHDYLGFLRAGNSIYKLACEADFKITASLLAKLEREKYDDLCEQHNIDNGFNSDNE